MIDQKYIIELKKFAICELKKQTGGQTAVNGKDADDLINDILFIASSEEITDDWVIRKYLSKYIIELVHGVFTKNSISSKLIVSEDPEKGLAIGFERDYNFLVSYAKTLVSKVKLTCDAEDLVNEAYVTLHNSKKRYTPSEFRKTIYRAAFREKDDELENSRRGVITDRNEDHRVCRTCNEIKPIGGYPLIRRAAYQYALNECIECHRKRAREWRLKNRDLVRKWQRKYKSKNKKRFAEYKRLRYKYNAEARKRHIEIVREYDLMRRVKLTDAYIRDLLEARIKYGKKVHGIITDEMIAKERERQIERRNQEEYKPKRKGYKESKYGKSLALKRSKASYKYHSDPKVKKEHIKRVAEYIRANKDKAKLWNKISRDRAKEGLADSYIRRLLKARNKKKNKLALGPIINITNEMIEVERAKQLEIRNKKSPTFCVGQLDLKILSYTDAPKSIPTLQRTDTKICI